MASGPSYLWLSSSRSVPPQWDLRLVGWSRIDGSGAERAGAELPGILDWRPPSRPDDWRELPARGRIAAVGVDDPRQRARLLDEGLGDALGSRVGCVELGARLARLAGRAVALPRRLGAGPVMLDLFHRDGRTGGRWLGLHPREFALLWRLAETPGVRVPRAQLLRDVWRLDHVPETNSLEVHVSRLRAKLHVSRCGWLVQTHPQGGYHLAAGAACAARVSGRDGATGLVARNRYQGET